MYLKLFFTVIWGILAFLFLIKPKLVANIIYKNSKGNKLKKGIKDIRNLGFIFLLGFSMLLYSSLY